MGTTIAKHRGERMSRLTLRNQLSELCFRMSPSWTRTSSDKELEQYLVDGIKETERELQETKALLLLANAELAALKSAPVVMPDRLKAPMPMWKDARQPYGDPLNAVRIGEVTHFNLALDEIARLNRSKT